MCPAKTSIIKSVLPGKRRQTKTQRHRRKQSFKKAAGWLSIISGLIAVSLFVNWWLCGWNGREPVNLVIITDERLLLLAVRPGQKCLTEIEIPPNTLIKTDGGEWQAWALTGLSKIQKNSRATASVGWELMEVPVDNVIYLSSWPERERLFWVSENIRLIRFYNSLNKSQITKIDLSALPAARKVIDPDGVELLEIDQVQIQSQVTAWFALDEIRREGLTVSIENSSGEAGAGSKLARALEHMGLNVVSVSNGFNKKSLYISNKKLMKTLTVRKLSLWLDLKPKVQTFNHRADILIVK